MPLYLSEPDVEGLITPGEAVPVLEACFRRLAAGAVENVPRRRLALDDGYFAVMSAVDRELGFAGLKAYTVVGGKLAFAVCLFELSSGKLHAVLEADTLGQRRTGAASGVAAKHLALQAARTLGVIGCGWQAESQVDAIRAAVPSIERVVAYCRTPETLRGFCAKVGAEAAESSQEAAGQEIVVTVTSSRDPVLRGEWLREGALVCAVGANDPQARELDNVVLDWQEVHELQDVVAGEVPGRVSQSDIAVFKSNGLAAWDVAIAVAVVERARERGVGKEL